MRLGVSIICKCSMLRRRRAAGPRNWQVIPKIRLRVYTEQEEENICSETTAAAEFGRHYKGEENSVNELS